MSDHDDRELMDVDTRSRSPQSNSSKSSGPMSRSSSKSRSRSRSLSRSRSRSRSLSRSSPSPARPSRDTCSRSHSPDRRRSHRERHSPVARQRVSHNHKQRQYINTSSDRENPEPSTCLGIFGLAKQTDERDIRRVFGRYGRLVDVKIVYDGTSGRSRGFGFVTYKSVDDAAEAKRCCNGLDMDGRNIRVDFSVTQRAHTPTPGIYMGKMNRRNGDRAFDRGDYGGYRARDAGYDGGRKGGRGRDRDDVRGNGFGRRRSPDASTYGRGSRNDGGMRYSRSRSRSPPPRPRNYGRY